MQHPVNLCIPSLARPLAMFVHGPEDKYVSQKIREEGIWEPYETSLVLARLNPGGVFIDVGANIGYFTVLAASLVGARGRVFAFEPDPANFALLEKNCEYNRLSAPVLAVEAGLSAQTGSALLYLSEDNLGDHQIYPGQGCRHKLDISLLHGADYLRQQLRKSAISQIDLIKVDTQGSEFEVMSGLMPLLVELSDIPSILIELTPLSLKMSGSSGRALIELLAALKQQFWIVDHIEHNLVISSASELAQWCDNVEACEGDAGFMNILLEGESTHEALPNSSG